jgi:hypothetical protein
MSLVLEKKLSDSELETLGIELSLSAFDNTLTQARYDELVRILLEHETIGDVMIGIILAGQPAWREKHFKHYGYKVIP